MKKVSKFLLVTITLSIVFLLTSCFTDNKEVEHTVSFETNGAGTIESYKVNDGHSLVLPEEPSKEGFEFVAWYLESSFATEVEDGYIVKSDITLYAKWEEEVEAEQIFVSSISQRDDFAIFQVNKQEKENKKTEFMDLEQEYVVGDDNAWNVKPKVSFVKINVEMGTIVDAQPKVNSWNYDIVVEVYDDPTGAYVDGAHLVEAIDNVNCTVDFKADAIGYKVRVSVVPQGLSEKQQSEVEKWTVVCEGKVVDGYNAYKGLDLAYIESRSSGDEATAWKAFKQEKGLDVDYVPSAIILHNDIELAHSDMPQYFFYTEEEVAGASDAARAAGSLKDEKNIYHRDVTEGSNFALLGNYFTFSTKNIREVVRECGEITEEGSVISHTTLFRFEGKESGNIEINNINLVGNAPRVENAIKSGGIILTKVEGPKFKAYNNIASAWFITYFPNYTEQEFTMDSCKAYDSYNCFVYNWGSEKVYIKNCEFVGAGGPVIIQDHVDADSNDDHIAKTYAINSKLESYVAGTEGWFKGVSADSLVPVIKSLDAFFNPFGKSFLKSNSDGTVTYLNIICVNKSGSAESLTAEKIKGEFKIDDNASFDFGATNPYLAALLDQTFVMGAPAFQTSVGGFAYGTQTGLFDIQNNQIIDPSNAMYQGDYLCLYYNGMALTFGFFGYNPNTGQYEVHTA